MSDTHPGEIKERCLLDMEIVHLRREGFLALPQLITQAEISLINQICNEMYRHAGSQYGVIDRPLRLAPTLKQTRMFNICLRLARQILGPLAGCSFDQIIWKKPHEEYGTGWHQDQAFRGVNGRPMNSLHFWIPLQPVTEENGCLQFVPRSHMRGMIRHFKLFPDDPYSLVASEAPDYQAVSCPLPAGAATIHLPLTLHSAPPNRSDAPRKAWILIFQPFGRLGSIMPLNYLAKWRMNLP